MHQLIQLVNIMSNLIFHCSLIIAMQIEHSSQFVKARQPRQVVYLMQNYVASPTSHFRTDS